eukprot:TRINITY_DN8072_c0_g1_i3.p1 TRINITY_DN8072_c0_g1~~TRINITY_DN8072_c0_g1_i3.p1  ORF type:complete len:390 (+),score=33.56 TRINITY_DN8072_c0_g1_i3:43-1212(+)
MTSMRSLYILGAARHHSKKSSSVGLGGRDAPGVHQVHTLPHSPQHVVQVARHQRPPSSSHWPSWSTSTNPRATRTRHTLATPPRPGSNLLPYPRNGKVLPRQSYSAAYLTSPRRPTFCTPCSIIIHNTPSSAPHFPSLSYCILTWFIATVCAVPHAVPSSDNVNAPGAAAILHTHTGLAVLVEWSRSTDSCSTMDVEAADGDRAPPAGHIEADGEEGERECGVRECRTGHASLQEQEAPEGRPIAEGGTEASEEEERLQWVRRMRKEFTPPEMLRADLSLNMSFFRPPPDVKAKQWGPEEKAILIRGIAMYGVGAWAQIAELFPGRDWNDTDLHSKAARLLGRQSLKVYKGWRGTPADIEREYQKNKAIGQALGSWKGGLLIGCDMLND